MFEVIPPVVWSLTRCAKHFQTHIVHFCENLVLKLKKRMCKVFKIFWNCIEWRFLPKSGAHLRQVCMYLQKSNWLIRGFKVFHSLAINICCTDQLTCRFVIYVSVSESRCIIARLCFLNLICTHAFIFWNCNRNYIQTHVYLRWI